MSPTTNQLVRKGRKRRNKKKGRRLGGPQRQATVLWAKVVEPRKPNSAKRKIARVRFADGTEKTVAFPGEGWHVREHDNVLVRGGRTIPDLVGVKWEIVRGHGDAPGVEGRKQSRSKYGTKRQ